MLFSVKDENIRLQEMMNDLEVKTGINDFSPGSVARAFLEVFNKKIHTTYEDFNYQSAMLFLSTSEGIYLDLLGYILNCTRLANESDDNYRYRISNQVFTAANANKTAIRLKCLAVDGVKDIKINKYTNGSGSFTVHIITDELVPSQSLVNKVNEVVEEVKSEGIRTVVTYPTPVPINVKFSGIITGRMATSKESIALQIKKNLQSYIDSLDIMGPKIGLQKVIALAAMQDNLESIFISSFKVDNIQVIIKEFYQLNWDERPYIDSVELDILNT